jgi:hypothetical protein
VPKLRGNLVGCGSCSAEPPPKTAAHASSDPASETSAPPIVEPEPDAGVCGDAILRLLPPTRGATGEAILWNWPTPQAKTLFCLDWMALVIAAAICFLPDIRQAGFARYLVAAPPAGCGSWLPAAGWQFARKFK